MLKNKKGGRLIALGVLMACVTLLGVFAAVSDTATSGGFSAETPDTNVDLLISDGEVGEGTDCSETDGNGDAVVNYVHNSTTQVLAATDIAPGDPDAIKFVCLINGGADRANVLELAAVEIANTETGCSDGEIADDPASCGSGAGELGAHLDVFVQQVGAAVVIGDPGNPCVAEGPHGVQAHPSVATDGDTAFEAVGANALDPEHAACFRISTSYQADTTPTEQNAAQSDKTAWRLRFLASV